jgi:hypothetical protein
MRLLPALLLLAAPAFAQEPPSCTPAREGMVACLGEKLCACRWQPGGALTGRPAGHRWDCGVLRPACGVAPAGPSAAEMPPLTVMPLLQGQSGTATDPRLTGVPGGSRSGAAAAPRGTR